MAGQIKQPKMRRVMHAVQCLPARRGADVGMPQSVNVPIAALHSTELRGLRHRLQTVLAPVVHHVHTPQAHHQALATLLDTLLVELAARGHSQPCAAWEMDIGRTYTLADMLAQRGADIIASDEGPTAAADISAMLAVPGSRWSPIVDAEPAVLARGRTYPLVIANMPWPRHQPLDRLCALATIHTALGGLLLLQTDEPERVHHCLFAARRQYWEEIASLPFGYGPAPLPSTYKADNGLLMVLHRTDKPAEKLAVPTGTLWYPAGRRSATGESSAVDTPPDTTPPMPARDLTPIDHERLARWQAITPWLRDREATVPRTALWRVIFDAICLRRLIKHPRRKQRGIQATLRSL